MNKIPKSEQIDIDLKESHFNFKITIKHLNKIK